MTERYRRAEGLLAAVVDDDVLLFDAKRGTYFATSGVGAALWEALEQPCGLDQLCTLVLERYQVAPEVCAEDVAAFLARLEAAELVVRV
jgi:hypothetical protein